MTNQEVFDQGFLAIYNQGCRSYDGTQGRCVYRRDDGVRCIAGHFIPDQDYRPEMEGDLANTGCVKYYLISKDIDPDFMRSLQKIHDEQFHSETFKSDWMIAMRNFAMMNGLSTVVIDSLEET